MIDPNATWDLLTGAVISGLLPCDCGEAATTIVIGGSGYVAYCNQCFALHKDGWMDLISLVTEVSGGKLE